MADFDIARESIESAFAVHLSSCERAKEFLAIRKNERAKSVEGVILELAAVAEPEIPKILEVLEVEFLHEHFAVLVAQSSLPMVLVEFPVAIVDLTAALVLQDSVSMSLEEFKITHHKNISLSNTTSLRVS